MAFTEPILLKFDLGIDGHNHEVSILAEVSFAVEKGHIRWDKYIYELHSAKANKLEISIDDYQDLQIKTKALALAEAKVLKEGYTIRTNKPDTLGEF